MISYQYLAHLVKLKGHLAAPKRWSHLREAALEMTQSRNASYYVIGGLMASSYRPTPWSMGTTTRTILIIYLIWKVYATRVAIASARGRHSRVPNSTRECAALHSTIIYGEHTHQS